MRAKQEEKTGERGGKKKGKWKRWKGEGRG